MSNATASMHAWLYCYSLAIHLYAFCFKIKLPSLFIQQVLFVRSPSMMLSFPRLLPMRGKNCITGHSWIIHRHDGRSLMMVLMRMSYKVKNWPASRPRAPSTTQSMRHVIACPFMTKQEKREKQMRILLGNGCCYFGVRLDMIPSP